MDIESIIKKTRADIGAMKVKYPSKIPLLIKYKDEKKDKIIKILSENDNTVSTIMLVLREKLKLKPEEALYIFHDKGKDGIECPSMNAVLSTLDENLIILTLLKENTFGDAEDIKKNNAWSVI